MRTVARNAFYVIAVDRGRNRAYLTLIGAWKNRDDVDGYIGDWKKAIAVLSPGFTVLTDATRVKAPVPEVAGLHTEAQKLLVGSGVSRVAEVMQRDVVTKIAIDRVSRESGMSKATFCDRREAEEWLDGKDCRPPGNRS